MAENVLYYGDNLEILRRYIEDESVDLVYLDPPFKSDQLSRVGPACPEQSRRAPPVPYRLAPGPVPGVIAWVFLISFSRRRLGDAKNKVMVGWASAHQLRLLYRAPLGARERRICGTGESLNFID
jgi:hypothetical protein